MRWTPLYIVFLIGLTSFAAVNSRPDAGKRQSPRPGGAYDTLDTAGLPRFRLPLGQVQITKFPFPETWEYNRKTGKVEPEEDHPNGIDSVLRGLPKPFNRLYQTDAQIIARVRPDSSLIDPFLLRSDYYKVDLHIGPIGYFVHDSIVVVLYKDAGGFQPLIGDEDVSVLQYIYLLAYRRGRFTDQLLAYYEDISRYEKNARYFYITRKGQVSIREFYFGELESGSPGVLQFQIGSDGLFNFLN
jgi:hypothetical protein